MRLNNYLLENITTEQIIATFEKECKSFLKLVSKMGPLYRGAKKQTSRFFKQEMHRDRLPKDTPISLHKKLNELFIKKFKWPVRNGIFCTRTEGSTYSYGWPYYIMGIGNNWKYCWSPEIHDLWADLKYNPIMNKIDKDNTFSVVYYIGRNTDVLPEDEITLKKIVDTYKKDDIEYSSPSMEISFWFPDGYYLIDTEYPGLRDYFDNLD